MSGVSKSPHPGFGTDGVRGQAIVEVSPEYVMALGRAVARVLRPTRVVLGRDPRVSGPILEAAFSAGASAEGVRVEEFGVLPTPALAMISQREEVPAVVITASHNKYTDNGVKVFAAGGRKLLDHQERAIEAETWRILDEGTGPIKWVWSCDVVTASPCTSIISSRSSERDHSPDCGWSSTRRTER